MSLINDALKRAKTAHQQVPASASVGPHLKPVEPPPEVRRAAGLMMPVLFGSLALLAVLLVWMLSQRRSAVDPTPVRAQQSPWTQNLELSQREATVPNPASGATVVPSSTLSNSADHGPTLATQSGASAVAVPKAPEPPPVKTGFTAVPATNLNSGNDRGEGLVSTNSTGPATSNSSGTNETAAVQPPPLKLQGLTFDRKRPSAVISGRTVFVGDRIRQMRLTAITAESAVLVGGGQTNVLTMGE